MRTLYYAGSFNPIHHGHLICARAVAERAGFGRVVIMPSAQNPFKSIVEADGQDRLTMCKLAVEGSDLFQVSDLELTRGGPSFTIDTVRALRVAGETDVWWLIGADQISGLPKWRENGQLREWVSFVVMGRPGIGEVRLPDGFRGEVVAGPMVEISGTEIRERVRAGKSVEWLLPGGVIRYIHERGLYGANRG